jgi:hypothetical protein
LTVEMAFALNDAGETSSAAVRGAPAELNAAFAERAAAFGFTADAAGAAFTAEVKLVPYCYERLTAARNGRALGDEEYRLLFRAMQFGSYNLYDAVRAAAPGWLDGPADEAATFVVNDDGHPSAVAFEPPVEGAAQEAVAAALEAMFVPRRLAGTRVRVLIGPGPGAL